MADIDQNAKCSLRPLLERQLVKVFKLFHKDDIRQASKDAVVDNTIKEIYQVKELRDCLDLIDKEDNIRVRYLNLQYFVRAIIEPVLVANDDAIYCFKFDEDGNILETEDLHKWWKSAAYGIWKCINVNV